MHRRQHDSKPREKWTVRFLFRVRRETTTIPGGFQTLVSMRFERCKSSRCGAASLRNHACASRGPLQNSETLFSIAATDRDAIASTALDEAPLAQRHSQP
jgi:hypothetical protein